jgi:peptidoglycan hydrolase-like protein with peptidoglycan-binding domain
MPLRSGLLAGTPRLEAAAIGPPSIKPRPPDDDKDAVKRIQLALAQIGYRLPTSFPNGPRSEPDGIFGPETEAAVRNFQVREFPTSPGDWDGRVGPHTLARLDARLPLDTPSKPIIVMGRYYELTSTCGTKGTRTA